MDPLPESLLGVCHGQEPPDGQEVGPGVHQDEEEHAGGVERGQLWVILHDVVQQNSNLDMQSWSRTKKRTLVLSPAPLARGQM